MGDDFSRLEDPAALDPVAHRGFSGPMVAAVTVPLVPWACSALRPRFWRLDAKAVFPLLVWLLHWSWWTLGVALVGIMVLAAMDWTGLPPEACLARIRCRLLGDLRPIHEPGLLRRRAHW